MAEVEEAETARRIEVLLLRRRGGRRPAGARVPAGHPRVRGGLRDDPLPRADELPRLRFGRPARLLAVDVRLRGRLRDRRPHRGRGEGQGERLAPGPEVTRGPGGGREDALARLRQPRATATPGRRDHDPSVARLPGRAVGWRVRGVRVIPPPAPSSPPPPARGSSPPGSRRSASPSCSRKCAPRSRRPAGR